MMDYRIAIPSYKRVDVLENRTLNYLKECKIPNEKIDIFVANEEEYEEYSSKIPKDLYNEIIVGKETLHNQRNFIRRYYDENVNILNLDDDVKNLKILRNGKLDDFYDLDKLCKIVFNLMRREETKLCGIYAADNSFFMDKSYSKGLYYCIGSCYWTINDKSEYIDVVLEDKEDFERTLKSYLKYGKIVRLNYITAKTDYYNTQGGMQETRTEKRVEQSGRYLIEKYPQYCSRNTARKKHFEVRFVSQKNNKKVKL